MLRVVSLAVAASLLAGAAACGGETLPSDPVVRGPSQCVPTLAAPIPIAEGTLLEPTFAAQSCRLLYVERGTNRILMRSFANGGREGQIAGPAPANAARRDVSFGGGSDGVYVAWVEGPPDDSRVMVSVPGVVAPKQITGPFHHAAEAKVSAGAKSATAPWGVVVFTGWATPDPKGDTDVYMYDPVADELTTLVGGPGQQRWPGTNSASIAVTDFGEDPDGRFDGDGKDRADIVRVTRLDGISKVVARPGFQSHAIPLGSGVVYYDESTSDPKSVQIRYSVIEGSKPPDVQVDSLPLTARWFALAADGGDLAWVSTDANGTERLLVANVASTPIVPRQILTGPFAAQPWSMSNASPPAVLVASGPEGERTLDFVK